MDTRTPTQTYTGTSTQTYTRTPTYTTHTTINNDQQPSPHTHTTLFHNDQQHRPCTTCLLPATLFSLLILTPACSSPFAGFSSSLAHSRVPLFSHCLLILAMPPLPQHWPPRLPFPPRACTCLRVLLSFRSLSLPFGSESRLVSCSTHICALSPLCSAHYFYVCSRPRALAPF
jgi:hypothetical protein